MSTHRSKKHGNRTSRRSGNPAKRNRRRRGPPAKPQASPPSAAAGGRAGDSDAELREIVEQFTAYDRLLTTTLTEDHPATFLLTANQLYSVVDEPGAPPPDWAHITPMLEGHARSEGRGFKAAAYAMARMVGTQEQRSLVDRTLGGAVGLFPDWLQLLDRVQATEAWVGVDETVSETAIAVGLRFATGQQATLIGIINLDLGAVLIDAVVSSQPPAETGRDWNRAHEGWEISALSLADARAQWRAPLLVGSLHAPEAMNAWPRRRAMIEWVLSLLPGDGNRGDHGLTDAEVDQAVADFLRSGHSDRLRDDPDTESIARSCFNDHNVWTDPLRWSALAVEAFLVDRVPRWHPLGREYVTKIPDVLAAAVRYGHQVRTVDPQRTTEAMQAIETFTPACIQAVEEQCRLHGTADGVSGRRLLGLLEVETAGEVEWPWRFN